MRLPDAPHPGLVLRYAYLWEQQRESGASEGRKDRPVVVVLARRDLGPTQLVYVAPVTHDGSGEADASVEIPALVKRRLGLDDQASFIMATELNVFVWPGPDLRPIRRASGSLGGKNTGEGEAPCFYGFLPRGLFHSLRAAIERNHRFGKVSTIKR